MTEAQGRGGPTAREWGALQANIEFIKTSMGKVLRLAEANSGKIAKLEQIYTLTKWLTSGLIAVIIVAIVVAAVKQWMGL